ncbi:MAG: hypothetical protein RMJ56_12010 [Gemmataceae bacterium]|nr:hypothetical protein [Gemmata sp.]MDW8198316.1 hypothetical protein [Gemmataceae bacterium]
MGLPIQLAGQGRGEQFYVTHCAPSDSVLNNPGYSVRAASTTHSAALEAAFHYPPYELPIDMWRNLPPVLGAPRRLARVEHPGGGVWVVHSAYLAKDSVGRDRSYFSHLLLLPQAEPAAVLSSWGANDWVTHYDPGLPKTLPAVATVPVGALVHDKALTAFLGGEAIGPTELALTVCPPRLRSASAAERRDLFARFLQAMLLFAGEENPARRRLYVHAEPGLLALWLYGAVRLLPHSVTDNLTFSTFEPYHRNLREYQQAEVIGTYLGTPERGLDPDLGTTRGIALDTFFPSSSSPELRQPFAEALFPGIEDLIELAAAGDWDLLPTVHEVIDAETPGLAGAGAALRRGRGLRRVDNGTATIDDLLTLQADPRGAMALNPRAALIWPLVKPAAFTRTDVQTAFRQLLAAPEHVRELWAEAVDAILQEDFATWESRWRVIRATAGDNEAHRHLHKLISSEKNASKLAKLPSSIRTRLRAACADVDLLPSPPLLIPNSSRELEALLIAPPQWAGSTACMVLANDSYGWLAHIPPSSRLALRQRVREFLFAAPASVLAAYVVAARPYLNRDATFLDTLFTPYSEPASQLMDRLLSSDILTPQDWQIVTNTVRLTQDAWGEFLLAKGRLAKLLVHLGDSAGQELWGVYLDALTPALLDPEFATDCDPAAARTIHQWERNVHTQLRHAAEQLTARGYQLSAVLPEAGQDRFSAANHLLQWIDNPAAAYAEGPKAVAKACREFRITPRQLVRFVFHHGGFAVYDPATDPQPLGPLVKLFQACFPVTQDFATARHAAQEAIQLSQEWPADKRGAFQALLLHACIPELHYRELREAQSALPLEPYAVQRLNRWIDERTKRNTTPRAKSTAPGRSERVTAAESPGRLRARRAGCGVVFAVMLAIVWFLVRV